MELFGVGPLELILILVIALIVLGPQEMMNTARKAGRGIRQLLRSPMWNEMMRTSREIRELPTRLVREAGIEEDLRELERDARQVRGEINSIGQELNTSLPPSRLPPSGPVDPPGAITPPGPTE